MCNIDSVALAADPLSPQKSFLPEQTTLTVKRLPTTTESIMQSQQTSSPELNELLKVISDLGKSLYSHKFQLNQADFIAYLINRRFSMYLDQYKCIRQSN